MAHRYFEKEDQTRHYQEHRLSPPAELQEYVVNYLKEKYKGPLNLALDVGCGNGQNSWGYSPFFDKVLALDVSPNQISLALKQKSLKPDCKNVEFRICPAEKLEFLEDNSVQLVTANSAAHWFDLPTFLTQVVRILVPNGVLALSSTKRPTTFHWERNPAKNDELTQVYANAITEDLAAFVHPNIQILRNRYRDVDFPSELIDMQRFEDEFFRETRVSIEDLIQEKKTYSQYQRYLEQNGQDAAEKIMSKMREQMLAVLADDLQDHEVKSHDVFVTSKEPFFALLCRKAG